MAVMQLLITDGPDGVPSAKLQRLDHGTESSAACQLANGLYDMLAEANDAEAMARAMNVADRLNA